MGLNFPPSYQSTSTKEGLSNGPADMPDRGTKKGTHQTTSSTVPLSRAANPVAAFGANPGQGQVQSTSTKSTLSRSADSPYDPLSATKPQASK